MDHSCTIRATPPIGIQKNQTQLGKKRQNKTTSRLVNFPPTGTHQNHPFCTKKYPILGGIPTGRCYSYHNQKFQNSDVPNWGIFTNEKLFYFDCLSHAGRQKFLILPHFWKFWKKYKIKFSFGQWLGSLIQLGPIGQLSKKKYWGKSHFFHFFSFFFSFFSKFFFGVTHLGTVLIWGPSHF